MFKATKVIKQMVQGYLVNSFSRLTVKGKSTTAGILQTFFKDYLKEQMKENYPSRFFIEDENLESFTHL